MEIKEYIASQLRSYRAKYNMSIQELSDKSSVNKDTISRYENSMVSPNIENLEKILNVFEIDFCIFFKERCANKHKAQNQTE